MQQSGRVQASAASNVARLPHRSTGASICPFAAHFIRITHCLGEKQLKRASCAASMSRRLLPVCMASSNGSTSAAPKPTAAETARTIVDLVAHGTLCTSTEDGVPLGTYVSYVLDQVGQPILRLRTNAVHTANLSRDPKCSLFVQPGEHPARLLARVTLIGHVEPVPEDVAQTAADLHTTLHAGGVGVDAPQPTDIYFRLVVDRCFYVGQLSGDSSAEVIDGGQYRFAEADPLRTCTAALTQQMNSNRLEDVMRISGHAIGMGMEDMYYAELLWVDRLGAYFRAVGQGGEQRTLRVPFEREVEDEREARSALTMMAQVAWELERPYNPVAPALKASTER